MRFGMKHQVVPLLAPVDIGGTATSTSYVDASHAHWLTFRVFVGVVTGDIVTVTLQASSANSSNATEAALPFKYRLSGAVGTDTWGAVTAATTAGVALAATDDGKMLLIDLDPDTIGASHSTANFVRAVATPGGSATVVLIGADVVTEPRYPGATPISSS